MTRRIICLASIALGLLILCSAAGCDRRRERPLRASPPHEQEANDSVSANAAEIEPVPEGLQLVRLPEANAEDLQRLSARSVPTIRVALREGGVAIDNTQLAAFVSARMPPSEEGETRLAPIVLPATGTSREILWPNQGSPYDIGGLRGAAAELRDWARVAIGSNESPPFVPLASEDEALLDRRVHFFVDAGLPYEKVAGALYSLGGAGFEHIAIAARTDTETVLLPLKLPTVCPAHSEPPDPCVFLVITALASGLHVTAYAAAEGEDGCLAMAESGVEGELSPSWHGAQLLGAGGACPALPIGESGLDSAAARSLLEESATLGPACSSLTLLATPERPWREVVEAMAVLVSAGRKPVLGADTAFSKMELDEAWLRCEGGVSLSD